MMPIDAEFFRSCTMIEAGVVGILVVTFGVLLADLIKLGLKWVFGCGYEE